MSDKNVAKTIYHEISKRLPSKFSAYLDFFRTYKRILNLKKPKYFQEKMQWVKLNANLQEYGRYVDKYAVREHIKETIGEQYLVKLYGVYNKFEEIEFDKLPNKFVLKVAHGSGYNIICKDKSKLDLKDTKNNLDKWVKEDYYKIKGETQYKNVPHRIVCEEYLEEKDGSLHDYKVFCFNGQPKFIGVYFDRDRDSKANFYDVNWNLLELKTKYKNKKEGIAKPEQLEELLEITRKLAKGFPHVRVDFYIVNNKIYFGELTFTTGGGCNPFIPFEKDLEIASWVDLSKYPKYNKSKGTGLKDKALVKMDQMYEKAYKKITRFTYAIKEKQNFKGLKRLTPEYRRNIKKYWKKYNVKINLNEFKFYKSKNEKEDARYITKKVFHSDIEPYYNNFLMRKAFSDKNYLDMYLSDANLPYSIVRNINGILLNNKYEAITKEQAINLVLEENEEIIIKPTIDSGGGRAIAFLSGKDKEKIKKTLNDYMNKNSKDYVIQKVVKQHELFSEFNSTSVNTVRVLSFLRENQVHILYSVLRVGKEGSKVDNASAGGYQIVLDSQGKFTDYIVNINNNLVDKNSLKYNFKNKILPFYDKIVSEIKRIHPRLAHFKLIGWDITVDEKEKPTIIEINLRDIGMSEKSQPVNGPLFGTLTDDVLEEVFKNTSEG